MTLQRRTQPQSRTSGSTTLKRVGEGLYRNPFSGAYFADFRLRRHIIKRNLSTTDLAVAKRKLRDLRTEQEHLDPKVGKQTMREITERHLRLQANPSSITKKQGIARAGL